MNHSHITGVNSFWSNGRQACTLSSFGNSKTYLLLVTITYILYQVNHLVINKHQDGLRDIKQVRLLVF